VGATGGAAGGGGGGGREHGSRQRSRVAQGCGCASVVTARRHHASDQFLVFITVLIMKRSRPSQRCDGGSEIS
jgi:hypothetical protein